MNPTNPAAPHHLPAFIVAPGATDVLLVVMAIALVLIVLGVGLLFLRLHTLPERIAHRSHKLQLEIVAVLGLIALFTHMHIFWIAGLLLALIDIPDFGRPLRSMAQSLEAIAGKAEGGVAKADITQTPTEVSDPASPLAAGGREQRANA